MALTTDDFVIAHGASKFLKAEKVAQMQLQKKGSPGQVDMIDTESLRDPFSIFGFHHWPLIQLFEALVSRSSCRPLTPFELCFSAVGSDV